jgi:hypothetical protein
LEQIIWQRLKKTIAKLPLVNAKEALQRSRLIGTRQEKKHTEVKDDEKVMGYMVFINAQSLLSCGM